MVMNPAGAFLVKKVHPKLLVAIGATLGVAATLLAARVRTFLLFVLTFSVMNHIGIGLCYFPPLVCAWEWIQERRGIATGIILGAYGIGGFIWSLLGLAIVNPDNARPEL